jgi:hypothetical protein
MTLVLLILFLLIGLPMILYAYFVFSDYYSCPFCGNKILKSENMCPFCSETLPRLKPLDEKVSTVAKAYEKGGEIFATPLDELSKKNEEKDNDR